MISLTYKLEYYLLTELILTVEEMPECQVDVMWNSVHSQNSTVVSTCQSTDVRRLWKALDVQSETALGVAEQANFRRGSPFRMLYCLKPGFRNFVGTLFSLRLRGGVRIFFGTAQFTLTLKVLFL